MGKAVLPQVSPNNGSGLSEMCVQIWCECGDKFASSSRAIGLGPGFAAAEDEPHITERRSGATTDDVTR